MKKLMATLVLGLVAPCLLLGQTSSHAPTPATIGSARHKLIQLQKEWRDARVKPPMVTPEPRECEPGPVQTVLDVPGGWCESVAVDHKGNVYTSNQVTFDVYRITPRGEASVFAHLYDMYNPDAAYAGALGMAFAHNGALWIAMLNFMEPSRHGIYTVRPDGSFELTVPMSPDEICCPNGLAFDKHGDLFITESINGGIWKVAKGHRVATLWLTHDQLVPPADGAFGANGIAYKNGAFFVANTDKGTILKVPINHDGTPGEPAVFASGLNGPDGVTLGPNGDLYVACAYGGQLVRLADDGAMEVLIDKDLGYPTTPAIVKGRGDRLTAYIANFFSSMNGVPSLVKVDLCKPQRGNRGE